MLNGVEAEKANRELDQEAQIIHAAYEPSFALQSFMTNPINNLLKPIDKQQFFTTLALEVSKLIMTLKHTFHMKTHEGMRIIRLSEVMYFEHIRPTAIYTFAGAKTVTTKIIKGTFTQHIAQLLQDSRFVRPHISYVLNVNYVESFSRTRFTHCYGFSIPSVAEQFSVVRNIYMNLLIPKERSR